MNVKITGKLLEKVVKSLNARDLEEYVSTIEAEDMGELDKIVNNKIKKLIEKGIDTEEKEEKILELYNETKDNLTLEELLRELEEKMETTEICVNFKRNNIIYYKTNTVKNLLKELSKKEKDSKVYLNDTDLPFPEITVFLKLREDIDVIETMEEKTYESFSEFLE